MPIYNQGKGIVNKSNRRRNTSSGNNIIHRNTINRNVPMNQNLLNRQRNSVIGVGSRVMDNNPN